MAEEGKEIIVDVGDDHVAVVEICRGPNNFFDVGLITELLAVYEALDADPACRAILLCSQGKHFCAGADFSGGGGHGGGGSGGGAPDGSATRILYSRAAKMFETTTPVVAAIQGAAVGGGLGLACAADFRVGCPEARLAANFARLGFHQGFGLSVTLPRIVGQQRALEMFYTGKRLTGEEAFAIGLCDRLVPHADLRSEARAFAADIAASAPLSLAAVRKTMRGDLAALIREVTVREADAQEALRKTADFAEGIAADAARRPPNFTGR